MKTTICKSFDFDAAHFLPNVPPGHKCGRMHGHTYRVELVLSGEVNPASGWFIDYADIASAWVPIHDEIDHGLLNDIPGLENPTTEVLAPWLFQRLSLALPHLVRVRVYESATTWCEVGLDG